MRKMIMMAIAGFLWKKFSGRAMPGSTRTRVRPMRRFW